MELWKTAHPSEAGEASPGSFSRGLLFSFQDSTPKLGEQTRSLLFRAVLCHPFYIPLGGEEVAGFALPIDVKFDLSLWQVDCGLKGPEKTLTELPCGVILGSAAELFAMR